MYWMKGIIVILLISFLSPNSSKVNAQCSDPYEILFIGSSYFAFNDLPILVKNFSDRFGKEIIIGRQISCGLYLEDHAKSSSTHETIKERDWDFVVIQGVGSLAAYPEIFTKNAIFPALKKLYDKIKANCETTKVIFCMPWAYEDGMTWKKGWDDEYAEMQANIYGNSIRYSEEIGYGIAPVGWAWAKVLAEKNYQLHYLHMSDWNHPNEKGSYLMACVIYASIFQESTCGNSFYSNISADEAIYFQEVASKIVLENLSLWNISPIQLGFNDGIEHMDRLKLSQNFPNPFHSYTRIEYEISEYGKVEIEVFDEGGHKVRSLLNENKRPGKYQLNLDTESLQSGMYFYQIRSGDLVQTKKMTIVR